MCNGNGHSLGCACGFGGDGQLGRRNDQSNDLTSASIFTLSSNRAKIGAFSGYLNPNAECPDCGDRVYSYRSPYDGPVFFDDPLGYPWSKHLKFL